MLVCGLGLTFFKLFCYYVWLFLQVATVRPAKGWIPSKWTSAAVLYSSRICSNVLIVSCLESDNCASRLTRVFMAIVGSSKLSNDLLLAGKGELAVRINQKIQAWPPWRTNLQPKIASDDSPRGPVVVSCRSFQPSNSSRAWNGSLVGKTVTVACCLLLFAGGIGQTVAMWWGREQFEQVSLVSLLVPMQATTTKTTEWVSGAPEVL